MNCPNSALEQCQTELQELVKLGNLDNVALQIRVKTLSPEEAIGNPERRDSPIIVGKERMIEAVVLGSHGQVFTDSPVDFTGSIGDVMELSLNNNCNRALFIATLNATLQYLNLVEGTVYSKDKDLEKCAAEIASTIRETEARSVCQIGLNPAIAEALVDMFGVNRVQITDLNRQNIGKRKFGIEIQGGRRNVEEIIRSSDIVLITSTALINGTFDDLWKLVTNNNKAAYLYGVSTAGVSRLLNLPRLCPCAQN
jgi:uncharacterized protein (DUF4213/DUF364 family)